MRLKHMVLRLLGRETPKPQPKTIDVSHMVLRLVQDFSHKEITVLVSRDGLAERWAVSDIIPVRTNLDSPIEGWTVVCLEQFQRRSLGDRQEDQQKSQ